MWTWETISGKVYNGASILEGIGYSGGACGARRDAVNNPADYGIVGVGPLPAGLYSHGVLIPLHPRLGENVIPLVPDDATRAKIIALGRDPNSFYWHGDDVNKPGQRAASDGCLVSSPDVRLEWYRGNDPYLQVVAQLTQEAQ